MSRKDTTVATEPLAGSAIDVHRLDLGEKPRVALFLVHRGGLDVEPLSDDRALVVGRDEPADIQVPDATLSRAHASFRLCGDRVEVRDLGSTNGTWLRGLRIGSADLKIGDEVMLGGVLARVRTIGASPRYSEFDADDESGIVVGETMRAVLDTARRVADARIPVILQGETGSGKEILARFIHGHGPRRAHTMISVNCAALPATLVESTLFGHERGAFTGAVETRKGVFEVAHQGTVFLDEIGELPASAQAVLLRVLETGTFTRVGATRERTTDVRVIAATHRDLPDMVERGAFRADLFYRLNTLILRIPPLRERRDEIQPLAMRFLERANRDNRRQVQAISSEALDALRAHDWPGNVRELYNAIERAVVVCHGDRIERRDLPESVRAAPEPHAQPDAGEGDDQGRGLAALEPASPSPEQATDLRTLMQEHETRLITEALDACAWNRTQAARRLAMSLRTLRHKIKTLGIVKPKA